MNELTVAVVNDLSILFVGQARNISERVLLNQLPHRIFPFTPYNQINLRV
ncbi:MAG: hypothetical protein A4E33_00031 [Methanoregula sp. PtaB.Bin085]|nr:MAG: hypothetical protein A4E33_00031 [Methanoregula sp. PtaB.Bin085]